MNKKLSDSKALLMHLVHGAALPEHLSKPRMEGLDRKALRVQIEEKLARSPLFAVCFSHKCLCGAGWQSFGYYAKHAKMAVPGQGTTETIARIDYKPAGEPVVKTFWHPVEEETCISCFNVELPVPAKAPGGRIGSVALMSELCQMAQTGVGPNPDLPQERNT